jgi:spore germination protein KC
MVKEILEDENIFTRDELDRLTNEQNKYIRKLCEKATGYSISNGLDILNLARIVENQNYAGWKSVKEDWPDRISGIRYEYEIQSRISKSFILGSD